MRVPAGKFLTVLEVLIYIAMQPGGQPVSARKIGTMQSTISRRYLEPVMQRLVHARILRSNRGPKGGYVLARERRKITLGDIFILVQEGEEPNDDFSPLYLGVVAPLWDEVETQLIDRLQQWTLDDLCHRAEPMFFSADGDFTI